MMSRRRFFVFLLFIHSFIHSCCCFLFEAPKINVEITIREENLFNGTERANERIILLKVICKYYVAEKNRREKKAFFAKIFFLLNRNNQKMCSFLTSQHTIKVPLFGLNISWKKIFAKKIFMRVSGVNRFHDYVMANIFALVYAFNYVLINFQRFFSCFHSFFLLLSLAAYEDLK